MNESCVRPNQHDGVVGQAHVGVPSPRPPIAGEDLAGRVRVVVGCDEKARFSCASTGLGDSSSKSSRRFVNLGNSRFQFCTGFTSEVVCGGLAHTQGGGIIRLCRHNRSRRFRATRNHHALAPQSSFDQLTEPHFGFCNRRLGHGLNLIEIPQRVKPRAPEHCTEKHVAANARKTIEVEEFHVFLQEQ